MIEESMRHFDKIHINPLKFAFKLSEDLNRLMEIIKNHKQLQSTILKKEMNKLFSLFAVTALIASASAATCNPSITSCTDCGTGNACTACSDGLIPITGGASCVGCNTPHDVISCSACTNNKCATCMSEKFPNSNGSACVTCSSLITNCSTCSTAGTCTACTTGFSPNNDGTACVFASKIAFALFSLIAAFLFWQDWPAFL